MKKKRWSRLLALLLVLGLSVSLLAGCGAESAEAAASKEDAETIQVYLWTTNLYDTYAPYIQSQLPDVNIEFVVGHNDLDFYKFLQENGGLPVFNRGSLPIVSGIAIEVKENGGSYTLTGVTRDGQPVQDDDTFTVSCLSTPKYMQPLLADGGSAFEEEDMTVRNAWLDYVSAGSALLAEPESYIVLRDENG